MQEIDDLINTLEVLRDAVAARDKDEAFEAVTVLLMQFMDTFGHNANVFQRTFPLLQELKNYIKAQNYDEAVPIVLALLAKFRSVRESMR